LLIQHLKKRNYKETGSGFWYPYIVKFVYGDDVSELPGLVKNEKAEDSFTVKTVKLIICAIGLQASFLTWGLLQERIMTMNYGEESDESGNVTNAGERFNNSTYLVFINRILALFVAMAYVRSTNQPLHGTPTFKFSYCSFSNVMSSWFQYEALKYVSFPTQVLGKACKVIPVMIMGKVVSGNKYSNLEWFTALMLSVGVSCFLFGSTEDKGKGADSTSLSGLFLMVGYMAFDSFTSNWQGALFKEFKMSSFQMMLGVNIFSSLLTAVSLVQQGTFMPSIAFMFRHVHFMYHCVILSICSAVGQLFIYYTIGQFGAVVFIIIMTMRQALAILLSCVVYHHPVGLLGLIGILIVFAALGIRINNTYQQKKNAARANAAR